MTPALQLLCKAGHIQITRLVMFCLNYNEVTSMLEMFTFSTSPPSTKVEEYFYCNESLFTEIHIPEDIMLSSKGVEREQGRNMGDKE